MAVPPVNQLTGRTGRALVLLVAVAIGGCGLADYEKNLNKEAERLAYFDKETEYLDDPVQIPKKKKEAKDKDEKAEAPTDDVFFRPPKGIRPQPEATTRGDLLLRFTPRAATSSLFQEIYVGVAAKRDTFWNDIRSPIAGMPEASAQKETLQPFGRDPLEFSKMTSTAEEHSSYYLYVTQKGDTQVAIVYRVPKALQDQAKPAMEWSLKSLAIGAEARRLRKNYTPLPASLQKVPSQTPTTTTKQVTPSRTPVRK